MSDTRVKTKSDLDAVQLDEVRREELQELINLCNQHLDEYDEQLISRAFKQAYLSHQGETRASGEPYYLHPLEVAKILITEIGMDDVSVVAALLHDTVEDTNLTVDDVKEQFGETVAQLIDGLTKIAGVFNSKNAKQAEAFMKLLLSMAEDLRVVLIKFADRLHNMRTIQALNRKKQLAIATETMDLYAPLAHRFGLFNIKSELEDLSFKVMDPTSFKFIARKLRDKKKSREEFVTEFMKPIEKQLNASGFSFGIKGRPKHIYSIYRKMMQQQKPFEEIYDLFAIRIILKTPHTKEDCWRVYSMITDNYTPIPERFRDFISVPKANGYQSLHTTVITNTGHKVEVQIRTEGMDEVAEKGVAAHWRYKEGASRKNDVERFVHWVREVLDNPRPEAATEFVEDFQLNLYTDEIYVFTPEGELRTLPKNATCIDFAFDIHSEVGERALAAKVNGKMAPLRQKLQSGDQVEIITGNKINLNPDWINDVVTHKARSRIRQFQNQQEREVIEKGRKIWEKQLSRGKLQISEQEMAQLASKLRISSLNKLFYEIGAGARDVEWLFKVAKEYKTKGNINQLVEKSGDKSKPSDKQEISRGETRSTKEDRGLIINGQLTDVSYSYARCCNPIPGDEVLGFLSREGEVKIHRVNCKNTRHLIQTDGDRVVDVDWASKSGSQFTGAVKIIGEDRVGLMNDISNVISKSLKTNIKSVNVTSDSGMFEGTIILMVEDIKHLEKAIQKLQKIDGVKLAYRYD